MLARLRREFVAIVVALVGIVLAAALGSTFVTSYLSEHALTTAQLERALDTGGKVPQLGDDVEDAGTSVTVTVDVDAEGELLSGRGYGNTTQYLWIAVETLDDLIDEALSSEESQGESTEYSIAWMRAKTEVGWRIAFVDTLSRDSSLRTQAINDLAIFAVALAALFVAAQLLSRWALRPVEQAWDQQRRFISDASHELKTPLAVILANMQILDSDEQVPEDARRWVSSTLDEASHMKDLVEDLLTLARADECEATGTPDPTAQQDVNLTQVVSGCALEFDAVAFERGCTIDCDLAQDVIVTGNPNQLGRVVRTLLDNATKYADRGSAVRVRLTRGEHEGARLTVNNKGEVISPEDLEHLFDRFFRTDHARERQASGGFGLGLAIAKSIVESAGGKIFATSTEEDGTTFTVEL